MGRHTNRCRIKSVKFPFSYVLIPKCASTGIRKTFCKSNNYYYTDRKETPVAHTEKLFAIIRDPLTRWASGILEAIKSRNYDSTVIDKIIESIFNGQLVHDEHTMPQVIFLAPFFNDGHGVTLFRLEDDNLFDKISDFCKFDVAHSHTNRTTDSHDEQLIQRITQLLDDPIILNKIKFQYSDDIKMYKTLQFPNKLKIQPSYINQALLEAGFTGVR